MKYVLFATSHKYTLKLSPRICAFFLASPIPSQKSKQTRRKSHNDTLHAGTEFPTRVLSPIRRTTSLMDEHQKKYWFIAVPPWVICLCRKDNHTADVHLFDVYVFFYNYLFHRDHLVETELLIWLAWYNTFEPNTIPTFYIFIYITMVIPPLQLLHVHDQCSL